MLNIIFRTFWTYFSPSFGNCFVFNLKRNGSASKSTVLPGPGYGLSLVLNLEQEHYGNTSEAAGIKWDDKLIQQMDHVVSS